jgi:hypothetical protein
MLFNLYFLKQCGTPIFPNNVENTILFEKVKVEQYMSELIWVKI